MASAEKLLHNAQYAFHSISYGATRDNKRNASKAKSLCKKIIRRFPGSTEAAEAHAILRRLGEEAYSSAILAQHRHASPASHHSATSAQLMARPAAAANADVATLRWSALLAWLFSLPKTVLAMLALGALMLWGVFGPLLLLALVFLVLLTGPARQVLRRLHFRGLDGFIERTNALIAAQRDTS